MDLKDIKKLATKEGFLNFVQGMKPANRFVAGFVLVVLFLGLVRLVFDPGHQDFQTITSSAMEKVDSLAQNPEDASAAVEELAVKEGKPEEAEEQKVLKQPYYTRPIVHWTEKEFSDLNEVQLAAARQNGLKHAIANREEAEKLVEEGGMVFVGASPLFFLKDLDHSIPYLVPKAHRLLNRISLNFMDSLKSKKIPVHKLVVTSVLRTRSDINSLKRTNVNATTQSCHEYGTTIDIAYNNFQEMEEDPMEIHNGVRAANMKRALGEVLRDLRYEGRCYVKHEMKQGCFHITVR